MPVFHPRQFPCAKHVIVSQELKGFSVRSETMQGRFGCFGHCISLTMGILMLVRNFKASLLCSRGICFYTLSVFVIFLLSHRAVVGTVSVVGMVP